jgi:P27 family predicted phage terminase small subunit
LGLLTIIDEDALAAHCAFAARWQEAERMLQAKGLLAKGSTGNIVASPLFRVAIMSARAMIETGALFGLSPSARARIAAGGGYQGPQPDDDKWSGLLA